jgi:predicted PurR-regulated permease PerM
VKEQIDQARWLAVLAATALALYLCWLMMRPFISVLAWAVVLVIVFYPVHQRLQTRLRRPGLSALLSCVLVVLLAVLPLTVLTVAVAEELSAAVPNLPSQISNIMNPQTSVLGRVSEWIQGRFGIDTLRSEQFMADQLQRASQFLLGLSLSLVGNIASGIVKAFFVVFTMYYLFRDGDRIVSKMPAALPLQRQQSEAIIARTREVVSASVYGIVVIASLQGLLGGLAFWILGVPSPLLWAVLMTFVCMIPVLGSFLVWLPLSIYLFVNGHWTKATFLVLWGALVISTIDNFLRPKWMKNQTRLHELLVFFSVLGGISIFGLLGIVLGPVVLAITLGLLQTFRAHPTADEAVDEV